MPKTEYGFADLGLLEQDCLSYLATALLATGAIKVATAVRSALKESIADTDAKSFNSVYVINGGLTARVVDGSPGLHEEGPWGLTVLIYSTSGKQDPFTRFGAEGIWRLELAVRKLMTGFYPSSQVDNASILRLAGVTPAQDYTTKGGTGGLKIRQTYALDQLMIVEP